MWRASIHKVFFFSLQGQTLLHVPGKMLVQIKYNEQQKYVKLDCIEGRFDFMQFQVKGFFFFLLI